MHVKYARYAGKIGRSSAAKLLEAAGEESGVGGRGGGVANCRVTNEGNAFLESTALLERERAIERAGPEGQQMVASAGTQEAGGEAGKSGFRV